MAQPSSESITLISVVEFGLAETAATLTKGFEDYFVPIALDVAGLVTMARTDAVDLTVSQVAVIDGQGVGVALVSRMGWTCRLAGMSVCQSHRKCGVGKALVKKVLADAKERGERKMLLEVIESNTPAVALYRRCGFGDVRRLLGLKGIPTQADSSEGEAASLEACDLRKVGQVMSQRLPEDWPWQIAGDAVSRSSPPSLGYCCGGSHAAVRVLPDKIHILGACAGEADSSFAQLLQGISAAHDGLPLSINAVWPEDYATLLEQSGLARTEMTQLQMVCQLQS